MQEISKPIFFLGKESAFILMSDFQEGAKRMGTSGLECAAGTSVAGSLCCCKVELAVGCKLKPVPSSMVCTPWGACSSGTLSISSSGLCLLWDFSCPLSGHRLLHCRQAQPGQLRFSHPLPPISACGASAVLLECCKSNCL